LIDAEELIEKSVVEYVNRLEEELAALKAAQRWIPVTEKLPKGMGYVLWYQPALKSHRVDLGLEARCVVDNCKPRRETTHWMPLPALVKEVEDE
jgi:hypothetical protein